MRNRVLCGDAACMSPRQVASSVGQDGPIWLGHQGEMDWYLCVIDLQKLRIGPDPEMF